MRRTVTFLLACLLGGATGIAAPAAAPRGAGPLAVARAKFDAFNRHDADAIEHLYASDATLHSPDYPDLKGNEPIADTYRRLFAAIPDARDELTRLESSGQRVYAQFVLTGHLQGAQDRPVSVRIISVYTIAGGRIAEDTTYYDRKS